MLQIISQYIIKCLYFSKVFHVRSVTQGDVIRADAKDIPRIFQVGVHILLLNILYFIIFASIKCLGYHLSS